MGVIIIFQEISHFLGNIFDLLSFLMLILFQNKVAYLKVLCRIFLLWKIIKLVLCHQLISSLDW